jgi:hypothetical protein
MTTVDETNCFLYDNNRLDWKGPTRSGEAYTAAQAATSLLAAQAAYDWAGDGVDSDADGIIWSHVSVFLITW